MRVGKNANFKCKPVQNSARGRIGLPSNRCPKPVNPIFGEGRVFRVGPAGWIPKGTADPQRVARTR